jgi:HEPN domain-containing protein
MTNEGDQAGHSGSLHTVSGDQARTILHWLTWADNDYLAARRLLLDGLLVQGASLANTAIEKYLKALVVFQSKAAVRGHNPLGIYKRVRKNSSLQLNESFLCLLEKSYKMRYPDDLDDGYNIVLSQALILDALDQSVKSITDRIAMKNARGEPIKRQIHLLIERGDPRIVSLNTALGTTTKETLLSQPSRVFECRFLSNNYLGAEYLTEGIVDTDFGKDAFVQKSDRTFQFGYTPNESSSPTRKQGR